MFAKIFAILKPCDSCSEKTPGIGGWRKECNCDKKGSSRCDLDGKCICNENVIGENCTECDTDFFGFPNCQG